MRIYALTPVGQSMTHSIQGDRSPEWRIIYFLKDKNGAEKKMIERFCGLSEGEASAALIKLQSSKPPIVQVIGGG